jgi:tRNA U55 pseudouridine synthase TruB
MAARRKGEPVHGWLVLDKPVGAGSTRMVSEVKRLFAADKAGHAGTLDPLASGLLPIARRRLPTMARPRPSRCRPSAPPKPRS